MQKYEKPLEKSKDTTSDEKDDPQSENTEDLMMDQIISHKINLSSQHTHAALRELL